MSVKTFQQERIDSFDEIDNQLKMIRLLLVNAKNETVKYYQQNPDSYGVIVPTNMIEKMLTEVEEILIGEEND
jgi:translation elongation factor EF-Ts